jgi:hypothetical protein
MMVSWIRFVKSIGIVALICALSITVIFIIWEFAVGPTSQNALINKYLLNPELQVDDPAFTEAVVGDLIALIQQSILAEFLGIFIISAIWLAVANFVRVNRPGDASTWVWVWYMVCLLGAAASAVIPIFAFQEQGDDLMRPERIIPFVIGFILFFGAFYYFVGSLLATPKHMINAIPLATKILFK